MSVDLLMKISRMGFVFIDAEADNPCVPGMGSEAVSTVRTPGPRPRHRRNGSEYNLFPQRGCEEAVEHPWIGGRAYWRQERHDWPRVRRLFVMGHPALVGDRMQQVFGVDPGRIAPAATACFNRFSLGISNGPNRLTSHWLILVGSERIRTLAL